jgi:hypothetical protein
LSCWERYTQVRRSSPLSPTGCGDGMRHRISTTFPTKTGQVPHANARLFPTKRMLWT